MKKKWVHVQNKKLHICDPENKASHTSSVWSLKLPPLKPIDIKHPPTLELDPRSHKTAETELPVCVVGGATGVEIRILCLFTSAFNLRCYSGAAHFGFQDSLSSAWSMLVMLEWQATESQCSVHILPNSGIAILGNGSGFSTWDLEISSWIFMAAKQVL